MNAGVDGIACPVCASDSIRASWTHKEFSIVRCRECDLEFALPFRAAPLEYYRDRYTDDYVAPSYEEIHPGYRFLIQKVREAAALLGKDQRRVLDIGCGGGYLLVDLHRQGFQCLGIDFNERMVELATTRFGIPARVDRLENLLALGETFDLVLLSHVLEHVERPTELLGNIGRVLSPGGVLVIEIPNRDWYSPSHSLRRGTCDWNNYPPHHITFWSTAALRNVLRQSGFEVLECAPRPFDDMDRLETFIKNRLGLTASPIVQPAVVVLRAIGRLCRLQGGTLNALARLTPARS